MIDCAGLVLSVGSAHEQLSPEGRSVVRQLAPDKCGLPVPGTMPNSGIAYLTSTMHDG
jgi:hypothetical protein